MDTQWSGGCALEGDVELFFYIRWGTQDRMAADEHGYEWIVRPRFARELYVCASQLSRISLLEEVKGTGNVVNIVLDGWWCGDEGLSVFVLP